MLLAEAEWGTIPDWITAFGTLAAFAVALRLLAKVVAAHREYEEDRRRAQARLVNAWIAPKWKESGGLPELWPVVKNGSDEPVYQVKLTVVPIGSLFASDPETARGRSPAYEDDFERVLPQDSRQAWGPADEQLQTWYVVLGLSFTDNQGRRWKRLPNGTLIEVTKGPRRSRKDYYNAWIAGELQDLDY